MKEIIHQAIHRQELSAAEILMARHGKTVYKQVYGAVDPGKYFDLASLTKALSTAFLFLLAKQEGEISLDSTIDQFFKTKTLKDVPVKKLLNHTSPLVAWDSFASENQKWGKLPYLKNRKRILNSILNNEDYIRKRKRFTTCYSDLGYILLGEILEKVYGADLSKIFKKKIAEPLGIEDNIFYVPLMKKLPKPKVAFIPTEMCLKRHRLIQGEIMDRNTYLMGGVSGHAGLFGTARSIHKILKEFRRAQFGESDMITRENFEIFCRPNAKRKISSRHFTYGFDTPTKPGSLSGKYFSKNTIGHLGYSGTSFWWDLDKDLWIIFLTNRCIFGRKRQIYSLFRKQAHDALMKKYHYEQLRQAS